MLHVESFQRQVAQTIKIDDWRARAQYMYRDWRPGKSQTCRRLCVRLGDSLHRAESPLHVWGKGHPVQKATPVPQERPNLGTNSFKSLYAPRSPPTLIRSLRINAAAQLAHCAASPLQGLTSAVRMLTPWVGPHPHPRTPTPPPHPRGGEGALRAPSGPRGTAYTQRELLRMLKSRIC